MTTSQNRLLLFDIDWTLITTGGAGDRAIKLVIEKRYGVQDDLHDLEIAGRTDSFIAASVLKKYGAEPTRENIDTFLDEYIAFLAEELPKREGHVMPGVREILERMQTESERVLGLLTGNVERGAKLKLSRYALWDFFEFGAFADDSDDRNKLGPFAQKRACERHRHDFPASHIDVIGDTGHDVACGKAFGARTIAVATGSWTTEQLAKSEPDFLFDDFSDVDRVLDTLGW